MGTPSARDTQQALRVLENGIESSADAAVRIGARLVVLCKFVDAVLPQLDAAQSREVERLFRQGVEDAMSLVDDIAVPCAYHTTLLEQTNVLLTALEKRGAVVR
jgi:hypothetical protein